MIPLTSSITPSKIIYTIPLVDAAEEPSFQSLSIFTEVTQNNRILMKYRSGIESLKAVSVRTSLYFLNMETVLAYSDNFPFNWGRKAVNKPVIKIFEAA